MLKKKVVGILVFALFLGFVPKINASSYVLYDFDKNKEIKSYSSYEEANKERRKLGRDSNYGISLNGRVLVANYGVVEIPDRNISGNGYTNGGYGKDGLFLGKFGNKVEMLLSDNSFMVEESDVTVVPHKERLNVSHYKVENGDLYHHIAYDLNGTYTYGLNIGPAPSELKENTKYYSYDGHYFYTDYRQMINDYVYDRKTSVNKNPYYNYYQYLPYRTATNYTVDNFKDYFDKLGYNTPRDTRYGKNLISRFKGTESAFIDSQNIYGANALLTYGIGKNESADGYSKIAQNKYNLFGHAAYDSSPYTSASGYNSNSASIYDHANIWMSNGYLKATDWRYYGTHLGNKLSGVNVKYASDPYWSENAVAHYYAFDKYYGLKDYNKYTIGINEDVDVIVYKEPNGSPIYNAGKVSNRPFVILGEADDYYKIQSDLPLNSSRSAFLRNEGRYNFDNDYGYIKKSVIKALIGKHLSNKIEVKEEVRQENERTIPFNVERRNTDTLEEGKTKELQSGINGKVVDEVTYRNNKEVKRITKTLIEKRNQTILVGTKKVVTNNEIENELKKLLNSPLENKVFTNVKDINLPNTILGEKLKVNKKNENISTGDTLEIKGITYTLIKKGDINKDGKISVRDIASILNHIEKRKNLDEISMKAITRDRVSVRVIADILNHIEKRKLIK